MAERIIGNFRNPTTEDLFTVTISDSFFGGDPTTVTVLSCHVLWDSDKADDRNACIIGSRATVGLNIPANDTTLTTFIEDFAYAEDARFTLEISKDNSPELVWRGIMKADQSAEEDIDPFDFKVSAVCGLGLLKDIPYHSGTEIYTGIEHLTNHLCIAMRKMPHFGIYWEPGDIFLRTAIDWWSASMASGADDDALYQAGVDHAAFYNYQQEGGIDDDVISCYDVIFNILRTFDARIFQSEGHYHIEQIPYRFTSPYYTRDYDGYGDFISSAINSNANVINQTVSGAKLTLINYDFLSILKKAEVTYDVKTRRNFLNGFNLGPGHDTIVFNQNISANGGDAIMRLSGTVDFGVRNLSYSGNVTDVLFLVPNITLLIGDNYLQRDYSISNFTAQVKAPAWTLSNSDRVYLPHSLGPVGAVGTQINGVYSFEILTPPLPTDADTNGLAFSIGSILKWNGDGVNPAQFQFYWSVSNLFLEVYDEGTPVVDADQIVYTATNPLPATDVYETTIKIGSALLPNSAGRLFRWSGSLWLNANLWGQGTDTRDKNIGDLLALSIVNGQSTPRRRMNGSLFGNFRIHRLMQTTDGRKWMFSRDDWDLTQNTMNGSWIELNYDDGAVSATPIKKKVIPNGPTYPPFPDPNDPNGLTNVAPGFVVNPPPTVLAPIAYNGLDSEILEGDTVTMIPIKTPSLGNEFLSGDSVTITHPYFGTYQDFVIDVPPVVGDTFLSVVSATALHEFSEDSYLTIKQKAYSFTPGNWYTHKGTISSNRVFVPTSEFILPPNDDACFVVVRRQIYQSPDDFTLNYTDNSIDFIITPSLNGQIAYVKAYA
jgi:hypothetical protein